MDIFYIVITIKILKGFALYSYRNRHKLLLNRRFAENEFLLKFRIAIT